ncbi:UNVERIFIED_CONTAM: hypothetical protein Sindi_1713300, partial [Sesamum indicum]
ALQDGCVKMLDVSPYGLLLLPLDAEKANDRFVVFLAASELVLEEGAKLWKRSN